MKYTTTISELRKTKPKNLRGVARNLVLSGLSLKTKLPNSNVAYHKPRIQFLYIHHIFDDETEKFDILLHELQKHHTFISYSEAVDRILTNSIDKPYISISSDDGFKNNVKAAEILEKYNAKGCFFINPDIIGLKDYSKSEKFCRERLKLPSIEFMDWNDIDELLKNGHEIGSHTIGHINIAETPLEEVEENLKESLDILNSKCGEIKHFAFPYGRYFHFNQQSFELVFKVGYKSCATAERGCHISSANVNPEELLIRRDHVVCDWNLNHIMFFLLNNSQNRSKQNNFSPYKTMNSVKV